MNEDRFRYWAKVGDFLENGSEWRFVCINQSSIDIVRYNPVGTGSHIATPSWISKKKATINVKNKDEQCFKWAVLCSVFGEGNLKNQKHCGRVSLWKQFENRFDFDGLDYPIIDEDVEKFEALHEGLCVVVLTYDKNERIIPDYISNRYPSSTLKTVYLLKVYNEDKYHFITISNLSRLVASEISHHKSKSYPCFNCGHTCISEEELTDHFEMCHQYGNTTFYLE